MRPCIPAQIHVAYCLRASYTSLQKGVRGAVATRLNQIAPHTGLHWLVLFLPGHVSILISIERACLPQQIFDLLHKIIVFKQTAKPPSNFAWHTVVNTSTTCYGRENRTVSRLLFYSITHSTHC